MALTKYGKRREREKRKRDMKIPIGVKCENYIVIYLSFCIFTMKSNKNIYLGKIYTM